MRHVNPPIASLDGEIAAAEATVAALRQLKDAQRGPWPKRCTLYVHGSKESNYEHGVELGLAGEALNTFMYVTYEITLEFEVRKDGTTTLLTCDGQPVQPKPAPEGA